MQIKRALIGLVRVKSYLFKVATNTERERERERERRGERRREREKERETSLKIDS